MCCALRSSSAMTASVSTSAKRFGQFLAFAFVVHVFVVPQIGGARKALTLLSSVNPLLIMVAVALETCSLLAYARLTQLLIPGRHRPGLGVTFGTVLASLGFSHVVPGGAAATVAVNYRLLGRAEVPADELGFALATQAIGSAVVLNLILWIALLASIPIRGFHPIYATAALVGAGLITTLAAAVFASLRGRDRFAAGVARAAGRLPKVDAERVRATILKLAEQLAGLIQDRRRLPMVIGLATANWLADAGALWVVMSAFGHPPEIVGLLVAYGLANVLAAVPVSPGGLGVIEAVLIPTLVGFGAPRAQAAIAVVAYRLVNFWLPLPVGAVAYLAVQGATTKEGSGGFREEIRQHLEGDA